jgi:outer membrane biosynthesis protein TonB
MDSAGHRANIMGKTWDVIGIGAYKGPTGKKMWTVLFADKCGSTAPKPPPKPAPRPKPTARPAPRPTPKPALRATPRPTPKAAPAAAPEPTPALGPESTPRPGDDLVVPADSSAPAATEAAPTPTSTPPDGLDQAVGLRVVDRQTSDGLLGTIVGGVAGFFFGGG